MAKKAAPVIGAGLGFLYGGPMLGSAIGGGLGSLVAGRSPEESLKFAAMAGLTGGALNKFTGMQGGQGLSGLFSKAAGANATMAPPGFAEASKNKILLKNFLQNQPADSPSMFSKAAGLIKENPLRSAMLALGLGAAAGAGGGEETSEMDIEKVYGTQSPFRDLGAADIRPNKLVPYGTSSNPYGLAQGGIISLADGGDFPRKNGPIAGPGTETSDEVPAMLSDGEFVVNAKTVRGLGSKLGGQGREDERDRGSKYLYDMQNKYGRA